MASHAHDIVKKAKGATSLASLRAEVTRQTGKPGELHEDGKGTTVIVWRDVPGGALAAVAQRGQTPVLYPVTAVPDDFMEMVNPGVVELFIPPPAGGAGARNNPRKPALAAGPFVPKVNPRYAGHSVVFPAHAKTGDLIAGFLAWLLPLGSIIEDATVAKPEVYQVEVAESGPVRVVDLKTDTWGGEEGYVDLPASHAYRVLGLGKSLDAGPDRIADFARRVHASAAVTHTAPSLAAEAEGRGSRPVVEKAKEAKQARKVAEKQGKVEEAPALPAPAPVTAPVVALPPLPDEGQPVVAAPVARGESDDERQARELREARAARKQAASAPRESDDDRQARELREARAARKQQAAAALPAEVPPPMPPSVAPAPVVTQAVAKLSAADRAKARIAAAVGIKTNPRRSYTPPRPMGSSRQLTGRGVGSYGYRSNPALGKSVLTELRSILEEDYQETGANADQIIEMIQETVADVPADSTLSTRILDSIDTIVKIVREMRAEEAEEAGVAPAVPAYVAPTVAEVAPKPSEDERLRAKIRKALETLGRTIREA